MSELIIRIDPDLCDGCGECITACSEDVIAIADGKAKLTDANYCDGFGECLPSCPTGAISLKPRPHKCGF